MAIKKHYLSVSAGCSLKHFNCWYGQNRTTYGIPAERGTESQEDAELWRLSARRAAQPSVGKSPFLSQNSEGFSGRQISWSGLWELQNIAPAWKTALTQHKAFPEGKVNIWEECT